MQPIKCEWHHHEVHTSCSWLWCTGRGFMLILSSHTQSDLYPSLCCVIAHARGRWSGYAGRQWPHPRPASRWSPRWWRTRTGLCPSETDGTRCASGWCLCPAGRQRSRGESSDGELDLLCFLFIWFTLKQKVQSKQSRCKCKYVSSAPPLEGAEWLLNWWTLSLRLCAVHPDLGLELPWTLSVSLCKRTLSQTHQLFQHAVHIVLIWCKIVRWITPALLFFFLSLSSMHAAWTQEPFGKFPDVFLAAIPTSKKMQRGSGSCEEAWSPSRNYHQKCVFVYVTFGEGEGVCCSLATIGQVKGVRKQQGPPCSLPSGSHSIYKSFFFF